MGSFHYPEMKASAVSGFIFVIVVWSVTFEALQVSFPRYPQSSCAAFIALCPETNQPRSLRKELFRTKIIHTSDSLPFRSADPSRGRYYV